MEIGSDSNLRYEQEPTTVVAVMLEDNWESHEVFEEDLSNPELAAVVVEYVEGANGYYPLSSESDNATGDGVGLVLNAEQEQAVQAALAGGLATVEVLTPFGADAAEVWSIQTYASSGVTLYGERSFTLTAITEEREILIEELMDDGDDSAEKILALDNDGGGDILITFSIEQSVQDDETPPAFDIVIEDWQVQKIEPMAKIQFISAPTMSAEELPVNDEVQAAFTVTERVTLDSLPQALAVAEIPPLEPENATFDENKNEVPVSAYEFPIIEDSEIREVEPEEILAVSEQPKQYLFIEDTNPVTEPETEVSPLPNVIDIQKSEAAPTIRTTIEYETVANKDVSLSPETEIEQIVAFNRDFQQSHTTLPENRLADEELVQSQIVMPAAESVVTALEALPSTEQAIIVDETIRYELPVTKAEYAADLTDVRQEDSYVASDEVEHSTFRTLINKRSARQSNTETERTNEVSTWEVSGFESTYNLFSASGLTTPAEDDIVIPFQTTIRTKRPSEARRTRSRVV